MLLMTEAVWHGIVGGISFALVFLAYYCYKGLRRFINRPKTNDQLIIQNKNNTERFGSNQTDGTTRYKAHPQASEERRTGDASCSAQKGQEQEKPGAILFFESDNAAYFASLVPKLRELCSPSNFMQPYDYEKVKTANALYSQLQQPDLSTEHIIAIRSRAQDELGVVLSADALFSVLKETCNPSLYMNPYNEIKVSQANELYKEILLNEHNLVNLERIGNKAKEQGLLRVDLLEPSKVIGLTSESTVLESSISHNECNDTIGNRKPVGKFSVGQLVITKNSRNMFVIDDAFEKNNGGFLYYSERYDKYFEEDEIEDFKKYLEEDRKS